MDTFSSHFVKFRISDFVRNLKMFDVRLNDNIKHTSGINLEGPSLIRRSRKVWDPPKNGPIAPMYVRLAHTSILGLCFMTVCLIKSNCYSLIYSSLIGTKLLGCTWNNSLLVVWFCWDTCISWLSWRPNRTKDKTRARVCLKCSSFVSHPNISTFKCSLYFTW